MLFWILSLCISLPLMATDDEIARGEWNRGGGHQNYKEGYNRYDNHHFYGRPYYNLYDENRWENGHGDLRVESEGIYDGVLLNNPYNPDVQYTQPGITDNFEGVFEQNAK